MTALKIRPPESNVVHAIALFEGIKGIAAVSASLGLLSLTHHDVHALAYALIGHFHLDPEAHYPRMLLDDATWLQNANILQVVFFACAYAVIRFVEGYGLWKYHKWAEWLAACSGGVYLPVEIMHMIEYPSVINGSVLIFNFFIVLYMAGRLWKQKKIKARPLNL
jgi:uncharacterized membrane protein (DUF2068 family)